MAQIIATDSIQPNFAWMSINLISITINMAVQLDILLNGDNGVIKEKRLCLQNYYIDIIKIWHIDQYSKTLSRVIK